MNDSRPAVWGEDEIKDAFILYDFELDLTFNLSYKKTLNLWLSRLSEISEVNVFFNLPKYGNISKSWKE